MRDARWKKIVTNDTDDNQTISTPRAEDPIPGTFQVVDDTFQVTDAEAESRSLNEAKHDYREETAAEIAAPQCESCKSDF